EVAHRRIGVIFLARARLQLVHVAARELVVGRLAVVDRLLSLYLRRADIPHPLIGAVGVRRFGRKHPSVCPAGRALAWNGIPDGEVAGLERADLVRPAGTDDRVAVLEVKDLLRGQRPVLLDYRALLG